jgi:hypothetical protein
VRDRDTIFDDHVRRRIASPGITEVVSSPLSPWQSPYVERAIGSIRRECLDHMIVLSETRLRRILRAYLAYLPSQPHASRLGQRCTGRQAGMSRRRHDRGDARSGRLTSPLRSPGGVGRRCEACPDGSALRELHLPRPSMQKSDSSMLGVPSDYRSHAAGDLDDHARIIFWRTTGTKSGTIRWACLLLGDRGYHPVSPPGHGVNISGKRPRSAKAFCASS